MEETALTGQFDMTAPLHDISRYADDDDPAEWIIVRGRPRHLRPEGWVYIRTDAQIVGRVKAVASGWLDERPERTGPQRGDRGPGPVVFVDPKSWDVKTTHDLSGDRRFHGQGIRYVQTADDGTLRHWAAGDRAFYGDEVPLAVPQANLHIKTGDEAGVDELLIEGARLTTTVVSYERNAKARQACIDAFGYNCSACDLNFAERYGELGERFIHVHHLVEISSIGTDYVVDPLHDLRPLCPNCHAMIHRQSPPLSIDQLRQVIAEHRGEPSGD